MLSPVIPKREVLLPAFGDHLPGVNAQLPIALKTFPQFAARCDAFDLDPAPFLLTGHAVMDSDAFDYTCYSGRRYLRPMARTMKELRERGRLRLVSYRNLRKEFEAELRTTIDLNCHPDNAYRWRPAILKQYELQLPLAEAQLKVIGRNAVKEYEYLPFGIVSHLHNSGSKIDLNHATKLLTLVESTRHDLKASERQDLCEVARPFIEQVAFDHYLTQALGATMAIWDDQKPFYDRMNFAKSQPIGPRITSEQIAECSRVFASEIDEDLRLTSAKDILAFISDHGAVQSLRLAIQRSVRGEYSLSPDILRNLQKEVLAELVQAEHHRKHLQAATTVVKVLFWISGATALQEVLEHLGKLFDKAVDASIEIVGLVSEKRIDRCARSKHAWYFKLIEIRARRLRVGRSSLDLI